MSRLTSCLLASIAFAGLAGGAQAIPFVITGGSATTEGITAGSTVTVTPSAGLARAFDLQEGQTTDPFPFLDVTVTGEGAVAGFINAELDFSAPAITTADGVLAGFSVILGWYSGGSLWVLDDPGPIAFGDGGWFDVNFFGFSDECSFCNTLSGTVTATVSLLRSPRGPVAVSAPATLSLLGIGLLAVVGLSRRGSARRRRI